MYWVPESVGFSGFASKSASRLTPVVRSARLSHPSPSSTTQSEPGPQLEMVDTVPSRGERGVPESTHQSALILATPEPHSPRNQTQEHMTGADRTGSAVSGKGWVPSDLRNQRLAYMDPLPWKPLGRSRTEGAVRRRVLAAE